MTMLKISLNSVNVAILTAVRRLIHENPIIVQIVTPSISGSTCLVKIEISFSFPLILHEIKKNHNHRVKNYHLGLVLSYYANS